VTVSGHGLFEGTIPAFTHTDYAKMKNLARIPDFSAKIRINYLANMKQE
jgi:hypothetical protein